jgi:hypothetical protein
MFLSGWNRDPQWSVATMAILILLRFIADIRWDINVNQVILIGFSSVRTVNDPNELGLDVSESETLFYDELTT